MEQLHTDELLQTAFADWDILRLEAYERELDEGEGHRGRSAVIDLIARRRKKEGRVSLNVVSVLLHCDTGEPVGRTSEHSACFMRDHGA